MTMINLQPRIIHLMEKKLIGKRLTMSLTQNKTAILWKNFMSHRDQIPNTKSSDLISMQVYQPTYFKEFNPSNSFEKWATIEVSSFEYIPDHFETFLLSGGLYAVFDYKGLSTDQSIYHYIYGTWIPNSEYNLDHRPHFEVLGDKYKNADPDSEEEIWIPIRERS